MHYGNNISRDMLACITLLKIEYFIFMNTGEGEVEEEEENAQAIVLLPRCGALSQPTSQM
jgi:hypothetical protein